MCLPWLRVVIMEENRKCSDKKQLQNKEHRVFSFSQFISSIEIFFSCMSKLRVKNKSESLYLLRVIRALLIYVIKERKNYMLLPTQYS